LWRDFRGAAYIRSPINVEREDPACAPGWDGASKT